MRYQIASMQVGKRCAKNGGVIRNHLNQSPELRHTLRIPNHPRNSRTLTRSNAHSHGQQHQRDKRDLHLGSFHSNAVLHVEVSSCVCKMALLVAKSKIWYSMVAPFCLLFSSIPKLYTCIQKFKFCAR